MKTVKTIRKKHRNKSLRSNFIRYDTKSTGNNKINCDYIKIKNIVLQLIQSRNETTTHRKKIMFYLLRDLYPEYVKNPYNSGEKKKKKKRASNSKYGPRI